MKWSQATPESRRGEWLVADDTDEFITTAISITDDQVDIGWSVRVSSLDGVPLPVTENLAEAGRAALREMMRTFDDGEGFSIADPDG